MKGDDNMALIPRLVPNKLYLDDVFDDFMFPTMKDDFGKMKCDIYEKDGAYHLEMDVPGFDKKDVQIEIDDNDYDKYKEVVKEEKEEKYNLDDIKVFTNNWTMEFDLALSCMDNTIYFNWCSCV